MGKRIMTKDEVIEEYGLCAVCFDRSTCRDKDTNMVVWGCSSYVDDGGERYEVTTRKGRRNDK